MIYIKANVERYIHCNYFSLHMSVWSCPINEQKFFFTFIHKGHIQFIKSVLLKVLISNQHIRMISEGSCYTEDWSNDTENSALHHRNKLHFKIYSNTNNCLKL